MSNYPSGMRPLPESADDYFADLSGILETAIKHAEKIDGLEVVSYFADAEPDCNGDAVVNLDFTAQLRVGRMSDPSDAAVHMPLALGQLFVAIAAAMTKAEAMRTEPLTPLAAGLVNSLITATEDREAMRP